MLTLEQIRERLKDRNLAQVARESNLTHITVWKVKKGEQEDFAYSTVKALSDYLEARP